MRTSQRVRLAGTMYALGGLLWLAVAVSMSVVFNGDPPRDSSAFIPSQIGWIIVQLLLLFGFFGIYWSDGVGRGMFGNIAFALGVLGHLIFVVGEIYSLFIGENSDLVPLGALVSAIGILLTGIAVVRVKQWHGWTRWMPLVTGLYPWLFMFPFLIIYGDPSGYAIGGWGLVRLALGLAIRAQANAVPTASPTDVKLSPHSSV